MAIHDEYQTPAWLFDLMEITFDLDVCAPEGGVPWLPAYRYFTKMDDGLRQPWQGSVWMNPPYSNSAPWVERFLQHRHGVALLQHCRSNWHRKLWAEADAFADPNHSTPNGGLFQFARPTDGKLIGVYMPVTLVAFGSECVKAIGRAGPLRIRPEKMEGSYA